MADFGLVKSFDIDDGELEGLSPQECFVLGYELAQIDHLVAEPGAASKPVHALNRERIQKSCKDADREYTLNWMPEDTSESWMQLEIVETQ